MVGAVIGGLSGAVYWALHGPLGALIAAVSAVAASAAATGAFHEDGLADSGARLKAKVAAIASRMWHKDKQHAASQRRSPSNETSTPCAPPP